MKQLPGLLLAGLLLSSTLPALAKTHPTSGSNDPSLNTALTSAPGDTGWLQNADNPHAKIRLRTDRPDQRHQRLLLDIRLQQGWKTYWRSPGEAGLATSIRWQGELATQPVNAQWYWPVPAHFSLAGIASQGYQGNVSLPIIIQTQGSQPLAGVLTLATCKEVCLLTDYPFSLHGETGQRAEFHFDFNRAMGQVPLESGLTDKLQAWFQPGLLTVRAQRTAGWQHPQLFIDDLPDVGLGTPRLRIEGDKLYATVDVRQPGNRPAVNLPTRRLSLVISDQGLAQESHILINQDAPLADGAARPLALWQILLIALSGGFILNFMPCVLPVIGLKLSSILHTQGQQRRQIRRQFIASSLGIIVSFMLLALLMTGLRLAGEIPGWGIQFQNPWFIGFMALVMWLFSANLFGVFEVNLPVSLNSWLARQRGEGLAMHVGQGMFATLLATPCSAPLLGSAVTVALAASLPLLWGIFIALGVGMSLPWLAIAAWPALVHCMPKPGRWMLWLRRALGLLMLISALWLMSLLAHALTEMASQLLMIGSILLLVALFGWHKRRFATRWRSTLCAGVVTLCVTLLIVAGGLRLSGQSAGDNNIHWQPLSEQAINRALAQGQRVFVDVTADWCITCKVNAYNVLSRNDVQALLNSPDVLALKGDWSRPSAVISEFLHRRGNVAVPFNQVYGPGLPTGEILPVLLTQQSVIQALTTAKGTK